MFGLSMCKETIRIFRGIEAAFFVCHVAADIIEDVPRGFLAPGSVLTMGAGFAFGLWKDFLAVSVGATIGVTLAFLIARFIARGKRLKRSHSETTSSARSTVPSANKGRS